MTRAKLELCVSSRGPFKTRTLKYNLAFCCCMTTNLIPDASLTYQGVNTNGEEGQEPGHDWRRVAQVVDRCFIWILLLANIVSVVVYLAPVLG